MEGAATRWVTLGLLAALGAAGVAIFGRLGLRQVDPLLATTLRSLVMSAALLLLAGASGRLGDLASGSSLGGAAWLAVVAAGLCGAASWLAYFGALRLGPAGPVAVLDRLSLPLVFLFGFAFLGESLGWPGVAGLLLVVAGSILVVVDQLSSAGA